jgi:hypothetical protein
MFHVEQTPNEPNTEDLPNETRIYTEINPYRLGAPPFEPLPCPKPEQLHRDGSTEASLPETLSRRDVAGTAVPLDAPDHHTTAGSDLPFRIHRPSMALR